MSKVAHRCKNELCSTYSFSPDQGSPIWNIFRLKLTLDGKVEHSSSLCTLCHNLVAYHGSGPALAAHLQKNHMDEILHLVPMQHTSKRDIFDPGDLTNLRNRFVELLLLFAADTGTSLNALQHSSFIEAISVLNPAIRVPGKTELKQRLVAVGKNFKSTVRLFFFAPIYISLTAS